MCSQNATDVIQTCSECTVAPKTYTVNLGSVLGTRDFVYVSDCTWETANFNVTYTYPGPGGSDTGAYKGTFTQAGSGSTLVITYVSGTDCLKLGSGYRVLSWKADPNKMASCTCNLAMIPSVAPDRFPPNIFAPCEACVAPVANTVGVRCEFTACSDQACYQIAWPGADLTGLDIFSGAQLGYTFTVDPAVAQTFRVYGPVSTGAECIWTFQSEPNGTAATGYGITVTLAYGPPGTVAIQWPTERTGFPYAFVTGDWQSPEGATCTTPGTFTRVAGFETDWPATLAITAPHSCTFGDINVDYGYGCGGGSTDCTGLCTAVSEVGASPTGFVWTFTGADPSNCVGASCICQTIDQITSLFGYPPSLGATAGAPCVSS